MIRRISGSTAQERGQRRVLAAKSYEAFRDRLAGFDCRLCPLHEGRTRLVVDRGNPRASVLLVGEGPGAAEDRRGEAFVGASGRLLDDMLTEAGLSPERDVLIANVVKCRPPENRAPRPAEVECCSPYLRRQLELVGPRCLVLLGATSVRYLLPEMGRQPMKNLVGRFHRSEEFAGIEVFVTFHPAFILRNRSRRGEMVQHLKSLPRSSKSPESPGDSQRPPGARERRASRTSGRGRRRPS
ncbi:MAG: uracil-DNA glycosylase [Planctomycetota bacterium]|nr:uracil-DNA glycosylase [Planctomycetota bacterium]